MPKAVSKPSDSQRVHPALTVLAALLGATAIVVGLAILPTRTWLSQRASHSEAEARLSQLEQEVTQLEARLELLSTDAEIERLARKNFNLVYPGEESYLILFADGS